MIYLSMILPNTPEEQIASLACVRDLDAILKDSKDLEYKLYIQNVPENIDFLLQDIKAEIQRDITLTPEPKPDDWYGWELRFWFDTKRARSVAEPTDLHLVQAFSIMLGIDTPLLPHVPKVDSEIEKISILLLDNFEEAPALLDLLENHYPERSMKIILEPSLRTMTARIQKADLIVGRRSAETYIASALYKPVVELYPATEPRGYLEKWANPNYAMIYTDGPCNVELIWRAIERVGWR